MGVWMIIGWVFLLLLACLLLLVIFSFFTVPYKKESLPRHDLPPLIYTYIVAIVKAWGRKQGKCSVAQQLAEEHCGSTGNEVDLTDVPVSNTFNRIRMTESMPSLRNIFDFRNVCGIKEGSFDDVSPTYPELWGLHPMSLLVLRDRFGLSPLGLIHIRQRVTVYEELAQLLHDGFTLDVFVSHYRVTQRGVEVDITQEISSSNDLVVWAGVTTLLSRAPHKQKVREQHDQRAASDGDKTSGDSGDGDKDTGDKTSGDSGDGDKDTGDKTSGDSGDGDKAGSSEGTADKGAGSDRSDDKEGDGKSEVKKDGDRTESNGTISHRISVARNTGVLYAGVSGDWNPHHLYVWTARLLGYKRPIAHGVWTLARALALVKEEDLLPSPPYDIDCRFKRPLFMPSDIDICFGKAEDKADELWLRVQNADTRVPHLEVTVAKR